MKPGTVIQIPPRRGDIYIVETTETVDGETKPVRCRSDLGTFWTRPEHYQVVENRS